MTDRVCMELAVVGNLGPALRSALLPHVVPRARQRTVLRLQASTDKDLVALLEVLDSEGLRVTNIRVAGVPRPRCVGAR
jgi:hypothetical protein